MAGKKKTSEQAAKGRNAFRVRANVQGLGVDIVEGRRPEKVSGFFGRGLIGLGAPAGSGLSKANDTRLGDGRMLADSFQNGFGNLSIYAY